MQIIPDLTSLIGKSEPLDEYGLEHALALLMTLSLRTSGKRACERAPDAVLDALMERLESASPQVSGAVGCCHVSDGSQPSEVVRRHCKPGALSAELVPRVSQRFVFLLMCGSFEFVLVSLFRVPDCEILCLVSLVCFVSRHILPRLNQNPD